MSFSDYMDSMGANKQYLTGVVNPGPNYWGETNGTVNREANPILGQYKTQYNFGDTAAVSPFASSNFDSRMVIPNSTATSSTPTDPRWLDHQNRPGRVGYAEGYVDKNGGFLGYGNNYTDLQNNGQLNNQYSMYAAKEPGRLAAVERKNIANEQAAYDLRQQRAAQQSTLPAYGGQNLAGLMGMQQAPQQSSMGRGSGFAPGQQYSGGMGRGAGQGLIGGMGRGGPIGGVA